MYRLAKGVSLEDADGTAVFLKDNGDAAVLNPAGKIVIDALLDGGFDSCVFRIVDSYDISEQDARGDVAEFVDHLLGLGLIEAPQ